MNRFGLFSNGSFKFAIPLLQIQKILQECRAFQLPCLPEMVPAVLVDQERLIPILNIGCLYEPESPCENADPYYVLAEAEYGTIALPVGHTARIVPERKGRVTAAPGDHPRWVVGKFLLDNTGYLILNIDFLAIAMTQETWRPTSEADTARRHQ